jgi:hypothetical protein
MDPMDLMAGGQFQGEGIVTGTARSMSRVRVTGLDLGSGALRVWSVRGPHTQGFSCGRRASHTPPSCNHT